MSWNFDEIIDRKNTNSIKWDFLGDFFHEPEAIPLFVADMDFKTAPAITAALVAKAQQGIYGYSGERQPYIDAVTGWFKRRHNWDINPKSLIRSPHVMMAIAITIEIFSKPGEKVIIMTPSYGNFFHNTIASGRYILDNPIKKENNQWKIDFADLEAKASDPKARILLLSNPHNPTGRSWSPAELTQIGDICKKHDIFVVSDEIHCDLTLKSNTHTPWGTLDEQYQENCIIATSASKTFNISGLLISDIIIPNPNIYQKFRHVMVDQLNNLAQNPFSLEAVKAAYDGRSDQWHSDLLDYIEANLRYVNDFLVERIPQIKMIFPEATYLAWLDCCELGLSQQDLKKFFVRDLKLAMYDGTVFGDSGRGFMRMNVACPRSTLTTVMSRIEKGLNDHD